MPPSVDAPRVLILWADATSTNLGVRALAEGTEALVLKAWPGATIEAQNYGKGTSPINISSPRTLLREQLLDSRAGRSWLRSFDLVIDTGAGDSFTDIYGGRRLRSLAAMTEFVHRSGLPLVLGPQTIGPFDTHLGALLARNTLRRATLVVARDSASTRAARALGRPADLLSTDVVFQLPQPEAIDPLDVVLNISGLLWNTDDHGSAQQYRRVVDSLIQGLLDRGRQLTLLPHVLASELVDNDMPAVLETAGKFSLPVAEIADLSDVRQVVGSAQLVLGSRMHACLNALSTGTPAIPLAYSRKFAPLLKDLGWHHVSDLRQDDDPAAVALSLVDLGDRLREDALRVAALGRSRSDELVGVVREVLE